MSDATTLKQDQQRDAEPVVCAGCDEPIMERPDEQPTPPAMVERHGRAYCSEDCYQDWLESLPRDLDRLREAVGRALERVAECYERADRTQAGELDHTLHVATEPEPERRRYLYPCRLGAVSGEFEVAADALDRLATRYELPRPIQHRKRRLVARSGRAKANPRRG